MKTYAMMVLGCKVNDYEATYIRENMNKYYAEISFKESADIYIIFTCCVTNTAEAKTRKFIHDARKNNPNAFICTVGCLCQIKSNEETFKDVDLIIGSDNKDKIVEMINENVCGNKVNDDINKQFEDLFIEKYPNKSRAFLKIQDGCNQFCSYCVIPYSRGRERSCNHVKVIEQAKQLAKTTNEIVLTGIHTGRYNDEECNLYNLLCELIKIDELKTIRLSSIELTEVSNEIIELIKSSNKIAHHLHIPVQSCDNKILKDMHRPYTIEEFINRVVYIRKQIPDISISTDLIVGFPGEDDEIFENIKSKLKDIRFSFIHVFPYSRKSGTVADKMENHIDPKIKKQRVKEIIEIEKDISKEYNESLVNKNVDILIERFDGTYSYGYTKEYVYCRLLGKYEIGEIVKTKLEKDFIYET